MSLPVRELRDAGVVDDDGQVTAGVGGVVVDVDTDELEVEASIIVQDAD